jgi:predicted acetyltransferase
VDLVPRGDIPVLERLWQLYRHDMSEFLGTKPGPDGSFRTRTRDLRHYVSDPATDLHLIRSEDTPLGFAIVGDGATKTISEFFVVRSVRRQGFGTAAALTLLRSRPGPWEIAFQARNLNGGGFWRRVAAQASGDRWHEERRPVPGKPNIPPDVWLTFSVTA